MGELIIIVNHTKKEYIYPECKIENLTEDQMRHIMYLLRLPWARCYIQIIGENQEEFFEIPKKYKRIKGSE